MYAPQKRERIKGFTKKEVRLREWEKKETGHEFSGEEDDVGADIVGGLAGGDGHILKQGGPREWMAKVWKK